MNKLFYPALSVLVVLSMTFLMSGPRPGINPSWLSSVYSDSYKSQVTGLTRDGVSINGLASLDFKRANGLRTNVDDLGRVDGALHQALSIESSRVMWEDIMDPSDRADFNARVLKNATGILRGYGITIDQPVLVLSPNLS